ncbi:MAG: hypothetical protein ACI9J0_000747 [Cryomorphaceae bacterium]|jgi:hypothetical protein
MPAILIESGTAHSRSAVMRYLGYCTLYCLTLFSSGAGSAGFGTVVPISAELASAMTGSLFPVALDLEPTRVFLTQPQLVFLDQKRIGLTTRFQIYDHRPEQGIAASETGQVSVSGALDYDIQNRLIVLHQPKLEKLEFDRKNKASEHFQAMIKHAWSTQISDPIRSQIPPHPYLSPFQDYLQDLTYDGKSIYLQMSLDAPP